MTNREIIKIAIMSIILFILTSCFVEIDGTTVGEIYKIDGEIYFVELKSNGSLQVYKGLPECYLPAEIGDKIKVRLADLQPVE